MTNYSRSAASKQPDTRNVISHARGKDMRIYLMRHGPAGNRDTWTDDDSLRPLTEKGERRTRAAADGLKRLNPAIDVLLTSPLVRARQTAEIVGEALNLAVE